MKTYIFFLFIFFSFISCEKEKVEYLNYSSEIFSGQDTLIYGDWKYIYSGGGLDLSIIYLDNSILTIKPIGKYVSISKYNTVIEGKIQILGQEYNHTIVQFSPHGIKTFDIGSNTLYFVGTDTLLLQGRCCDNLSHYYKRIK
jgi:hypothetical protein